MADEENVRRGSSHVVLDPVTVSSRARSRQDFSIVHMLAGARFSRQTKDAETRSDNDEILQLSVACVISVVAALEAYANELFFDAEVSFPGQRPEFLSGLWTYFETRQTLDKFEVALLLRNRPSLDKGKNPHQDVAALIRLRNAAVHFKSEWEDEPTTHARVTGALAGRYPMAGGNQPKFPSQWAGHACTSWAVTSAIQFVRDFEVLAQLPDVYGPFSPSLSV